VRIFVYEYLTAGGCYLDGDELPSGSLLREGTAMLEAVCRDLSRLPQVQTVGLRDARLPDAVPFPAQRETVADAESHGHAFDHLARAADFTLLIAPEINGRLTQLTERAEQLGAPLISPHATFVRLASDKVKTIEHLAQAGVRVPPTFACRTPDELASIPAGRWVSKPKDGAGSWQVCWLDRDEMVDRLDDSRVLCVQAFCPGRPASVAALCGCGEPELLPPCWQWIATPSFAYRGGELMTDLGMIERARRLARDAFAALPPTRGYVGLDLILGPDPRGRDDVVIEVNPRLTTSYIGLCRRAGPNLAEAMWLRAIGRPAGLSFEMAPLQFDADGTVRSDVGRPNAERMQN
jgi:predicted ATP-grasp superfamily ATP-dependent carboligase